MTHDEHHADILDDGTIPIAPEQPPTYKKCAVCMAPMAPGSPQCSRCGYDERRGPRSSSLYERIKAEGQGGYKPTRACRKCGYDLAGVATGTCPECGTFNGTTSARASAQRQTEDSLWETYKAPAIAFAIGLAGTLILYALAAPHLIEPYLLRFAIRAPFMYMTFLICSVMWLGFDKPMLETAIRFIAIIPAVDLAGLLGEGFFSWLLVPGLVHLVMLPRWIQVVAMFGLLKEICDVEIEDAAILSILLVVVYTATSFFILPQVGLPWPGLI